MPRLPPVMMTTLSVKLCPPKATEPIALISRPAPASEIQHQPLRIFQAFLDPHQEGHRFLAVDHAVIVRQRQVHHRANLDLAADRNRALLYLVHSENSGLRGV